MALKVNGGRLHTHVNRVFGGNAVAGIYGMGVSSLRMSLERTGGVLNNFAAGQGTISGVTVKASLPDGYRHPASWKLPKKSGGLSTHNAILGSGSFAGAGAMGLNAEATLSGAGSLSGVGALIISMVAALSGSGTISSATARAYLNLAASLSGSGDMAGAIKAIGHLSAILDGGGDATATIRATGTMEAGIVVTGTGLSTSNVGAAVWAAIAEANNTPGSMGQKLNAAGGAADPLTNAVPGSYAPGTAGYVLGENLDAKVSEAGDPAAVWQQVIESGYTAGDVLRLLAALGASQAAGGGTSVITFKSLSGSKDRVKLNISNADGDRSAPTLVDLTA